MRSVYPIVGMRFRPEEAQAVLRAAKAGDAVTLARDPQNEHDPSNSVRVMLGDQHVGFLPSAMMAKGLARRIDETGAEQQEGQTGKTVAGRVVFSSDRKPLVEIEE